MPDSLSGRHEAPRIAFCTDTFEEANGVATVSRAYASFAHKHQLPFLLVRPGLQTSVRTEGSVTTIEVAKGPFCLPLDMGLRFDLLISRRAPWLRERLLAFQPDLLHITGPGDIGMLCARLSHTLSVPKPPLVAAWHTNVHQYARMRATPLLRVLPKRLGEAVGSRIEAATMTLAARFYRTARLILAPNREILDQLTTRTGKPGCLMPHGVDAELFVPRAKPPSDKITLGYAGRLTTEKNVRFLAELASRLPQEARRRVRFLIVGDGSQRHWLEQALPPGTEFTGMLCGAELARAYSEMDLFLFPSLSDTFGLVVLEAMASGVPVVSFQASGPKSIVNNGVNGFVGEDPVGFVQSVNRLVLDCELRERFALAARKTALSHSWDSVFATVCDAYFNLLSVPQEQPALIPAH